jgi:predicted metal-dependent hydrolase
MSVNPCILQVGNIEALVVRKPIKNLHLSVLPPIGRVRVSAPLSMKDDAIRTLLATRLRWIKKQQEKFRNQERQTPRDYVSGESHYFWGKRYRLEVVYDKKPFGVSLKGKGKIILSAPPNSSRTKRKQIMSDWYRSQLRSVAKGLIEKWLKIMGISLNEWGIKRMKTRWGTCNQKAGRIWLNLELVKKPLYCTEYVVVHELLHLVEKKHNDRFVALITKYVPKWKSIKEELNRFILSSENWKKL